jgi:hypothetical protein
MYNFPRDSSVRELLAVGSGLVFEGFERAALEASKFDLRSALSSADSLLFPKEGNREFSKSCLD